MHQDEFCSCIVIVNRSEAQSAQPVEAEEEAPEPQDGSLWWHGMFTRAGRMGNMASDVRPDGQEQGKKVPNDPFFIHLLNQQQVCLLDSSEESEGICWESNIHQAWHTR